MTTKRIALVLLAAVVMFLQVGVAEAQRRKVKLSGQQPRVETEAAAPVESEATAQQADSSTQEGQAPQAVEPIVGSWEATFISAADPPNYPPIPGLLTFTADGNVLETDGSLVVPSVEPETTVYASPAHGTWRKIGNRLYEFKFEILYLDSEYTFLGRGVLKGRIRIDTSGNTFRGVDSFQIFFPDRTPVPDSGAEERNRGRRIRI